MLSVKEAIKIAKRNIPQGEIQSGIIYNGLYVFMIFTDDELEGKMDPFYSVDIETGKFAEFSVITDGDIREIMRRFEHYNFYKKK